MPMLPAMLTILCAALAGAADFTVDVEASRIAFSGTSTLHDFAGTAKLSRGSLHLAVAGAGGSVVADAASMATGSEGRDERMHHFVMDVAAFPTVSFALDGWTPDAGGGTASGTWTMKGVGKPLRIPVRIANGHATARFPLNIRDWGIRTPRFVFVTVGDIVTVDLDLVLKPAP